MTKENVTVYFKFSLAVTQLVFSKFLLYTLAVSLHIPARLVATLTSGKLSVRDCLWVLYEALKL